MCRAERARSIEPSGCFERYPCDRFRSEPARRHPNRAAARAVDTRASLDLLANDRESVGDARAPGHGVIEDRSSRRRPLNPRRRPLQLSSQLSSICGCEFRSVCRIRGGQLGDFRRIRGSDQCKTQRETLERRRREGPSSPHHPREGDSPHRRHEGAFGSALLIRIRDIGTSTCSSERERWSVRAAMNGGPKRRIAAPSPRRTACAVAFRQVS